QLYQGSGIFINKAALTNAPMEISDGDSLTLNFVNADIRDVLHSVLKTTLAINYIVDPGIEGTITLQSANPVPRAAVLSALEAVLGFNGLALIRETDLLKIVPRRDALLKASGFRYASP